MTDANALDLREVRKTYQVGDEEVVALDDASLHVAADEIVALVGPSGSGKTTLCSIAGGLLSATDGTVVVDGQDITGYSGRQLTDFRRSSVGFVFQSVNLVPFLTARENLLVVDELSLGLAPVIIGEVYQRLAEIRRLGTALLLVEQYVEHALGIAESIVVLRAGEVAYAGAPLPTDELSQLFLAAG